MHFDFIPYGKRSEVELLLRDMEAQKHFLPMRKGKKKMGRWIQGQVRLLPFGVYEYVFPKEDMNVVLNTLIVEKDRYELGDFKIAMFRKMLKLKPIPEYKNDNKYLWIKDNVNIIPLGVKEDEDYTDPSGESKGWTHEAI